MNIYFSDFFDVDENILEEYGALNISLINDLPLFIDPFLLFNSKKTEYQKLHDDIINYVAFLKEKSEAQNVNKGLLYSWFMFSEVKQNWFGYSQQGNGGNGLGPDFAKSLNKNLRYIFADFGSEKITDGSHLEKLCLIKDGVGKDHISDFTTNLIKEFILKYTEAFAIKNLFKSKLKKIKVSKVRFNYNTESWESDYFTLPYDGLDYVLLTPKDILTKDDTWINRNDLVDEFYDIVSAIPNEQLRAQVNNYFYKALPNKRKHTKKDIKFAVQYVIDNMPEVLDYYIKYKEDNGAEAKHISGQKVKEIESRFILQLEEFVEILSEKTKFYNLDKFSFDASYKRILFLKQVIENNNGYKLFYYKNKPIQREADLQIIFRLTWFASSFEVDSEVDNGRGPVDYKISKGSSDKTLVEFKLASNSQLKRNLANQIEVYKKANSTINAIKVILYFNQEEYLKVQKILKELKISDDKNMILIDASKENKKSASKV
jgi:hypothetical protein